MTTKILILSLFIVMSNTSFSRDQFIGKTKVSVEKLYDEKDVIWGMTFLNDEELLLTKRKGQLVLLNVKTKQHYEIGGVPKVFVEDQGGLLDVFYDKKEKVIYLTYSDAESPKPTTSLYKATLDKEKKVLDGQRIFMANAFDEGGVHFGSRVVVDEQGYLFLTVGERNKRHEAQKLSNHQGKILRLTKEGKAAPGNPFINNKDALPEIYSFGHRNPQGLAISAEGVIWSAEYGPRGGDEINIISPGLNYGWPVITYGREYHGPKIGSTSKAGMEQPVHYWVPSMNPSGITFYNGHAFPKLKGQMLLASLLGHVHRVELVNGKVKSEEKILEDVEGRIRDVEIGPDSFIYFSSDNGKIFRAKPL